MEKRVAVIGAGSSGITAVKNLVEAGFNQVVCYERRDVIGGLWFYKETAARWNDEACVNRSTVVNTSKEFLAYSDFPMPDYFANFCHNSDVEEYLKKYCKHFGIEKYIKLNTEVLSLKKHRSYESTGKWEIQVKDHSTGNESLEDFDFVIVANGHHGEPILPKFPGLENFQGVTMHSRDYKDVRSTSGSRAVIVGIGNSAGDISVELGKCMKVFLSTRSGAWFHFRLHTSGLPWDYYYHNRLGHFLRQILPRSYRNSKVKDKLKKRFPHDLFHLTPDFEPDDANPTLVDDLTDKIASGRVVIKPNIKLFTKKGVIFEDGTFEDNIDLVVFATGYNIVYPFIDKELLNVQDNKVSMYLLMWLPELTKNTLAFLGLCQPIGSMFPIAEMQSRFIAKVFKGEIVLPSKDDMCKEICARNKWQSSIYHDSPRNTIRVPWLPYLDQLAKAVGCKPNMYKLLVTEPRLFWRLLTGPGVSYQYRLEGPNAWPGARHAIFTVMDRIKKPFATRPLVQRNASWGKQFVLMTMSFVVFAAATFFASEDSKWYLKCF
ncbi:flavin-containing monooxygenase 5-like [Biomphalaria glabrata]|uniref:Flavin-containing monooxygenase n=1 Tax=Biomphalaria glabrata TaxID=6526 RepID=A0A9W2YMU3_BIOGL|nr:flavin-containing monooxygenase 5-like [Biomphalaria glabrata]XP_055864136.1 flavin-containing monooxygenase 5-like [Biomphalaria glabrata]